MKTGNKNNNNYFCIFDYYLDGVFLKWEEIKGKCPILAYGEKLVVSLEDGTEVTGKIVETQPISENEKHIYLSSC